KSAQGRYGRPGAVQDRGSAPGRLYGHVCPAGLQRAPQGKHRAQRRVHVGGDKGELNTGVVLHGGRGDDGRMNWDGMNANAPTGNGGGQYRAYFYNTVGAQEVSVDTGGNSAETETGGANINVVPKAGG